MSGVYTWDSNTKAYNCINWDCPLYNMGNNPTGTTLLIIPNDIVASVANAYGCKRQLWWYVHY